MIGMKRTRFDIDRASCLPIATYPFWTPDMITTFCVMSGESELIVGNLAQKDVICPMNYHMDSSTARDTVALFLQLIRL